MLLAATPLMVVDAMRFKTRSDIVQQAVVRARQSHVQVGQQSDPTWFPINATAACRRRGDDYFHTDHGDSFKTYRNYTLEMCKSRCDAHYKQKLAYDLGRALYVGRGCIAIDYFSVSGDCTLYSRGCSFPLFTEDGASSHARRAPCDDHSCPSGYVKKPNAIGRSSNDATCCERVWSITSTNAACAWNSERISSMSFTMPHSSGPKPTLEMCKAWCSAADLSGLRPCVAIDYFSDDGACALYDKACTTPSYTERGASSYMYQDMRTTCDAYSCPTGYSLKADASNINYVTGQGRDLSTCCEACPATDCACFVRNAVLRDSAWRRWGGETCKCTVGNSLHGDDELCQLPFEKVGRKFDPRWFRGKRCFCAAD